MQKSVDIRRNDQVQVITGRDKGKQGRVLRVMPDEGKVLVEHVMMVKKNVRPNPQKNIKGGIAEQESAISLSNVMLRVQFLQPAGARGPRTSRRPACAGVQELRQYAGEVEPAVGTWHLALGQDSRYRGICQWLSAKCQAQN